jgi:hypothetical protein
MTGSRPRSSATGSVISSEASGKRAFSQTSPSSRFGTGRRVMKFSRYDRPYSDYSSWASLCAEGTWRRTTPDVLPNSFPKALLGKTNSVLLMAAGSGLASVFVVNLNRVDFSASAVDQEPYIAVFDHSAPSASGGFVHHGSWVGRTDVPDSAFFDAVSASGIQAYYPLSQMPMSASGQLEELPISSQKEAFWTALRLLRTSSG